MRFFYNPTERSLIVIVLSLFLFSLAPIEAYGIDTQGSTERGPLSDSQQATGDQVFGLRGKLRPASNQSFGNYFDTLDGKSYGVVGEKVEIEQQIISFANSNPSVLVKIWGTIQSIGADGAVIIVSGILADQSSPPVLPPVVVATPTVPIVYPIAYLVGASATMRLVPAGDGSVAGQLSAEQKCPVTARLADNSWWFVRCGQGVEGWVSRTEITVVGAVTSVVVENAQVTATPTLPSPPSPTPTPVPASAWLSTFFNNTNLAGSPVWTATNVEPYINWGRLAPTANLPVDNFSARFERTLDFASGNYRFEVQVDDGVRVFLDGQLLINQWNQLLAGPQSYRADQVIAGKHTIRVEFLELQGDAYLYFVVNPLVVRSEWTVSYFNNLTLQGNPIANQVVARGGVPIDVNWGGQSPLPGLLAADNWSTRWQGRYTFESGNYIFNANSDDGIRLYFDNQLVFNGWNDGAHLNLSQIVYSVIAGDHDVRVEHYERSGAALFRVWWFKDQGNNPQ